MTEWEDLKSYDWNKIYDGMQKPAFLFDGRNILKKEEMEKQVSGIILLEGRRRSFLLF